jgi:glutathione peroxidase
MGNHGQSLGFNTDKQNVHSIAGGVRMKVLMCAAAAVFGLAGVSAMAADSVHDFKMKSLDGKDVSLGDYKGKVLLVVNVASRCGATPQYEQLQAMYKQHKDDGLVVMGFPCNQFGAQEPGTAAEIQTFCKETYDVSFPMFAKIDVNGDKQAPLYQYLKANANDTGDIGWNFEKFLIGKDGKVVARFKTRTKPDAPEVMAAIKTELSN